MLPSRQYQLLTSYTDLITKSRINIDLLDPDRMVKQLGWVEIVHIPLSSTRVIYSNLAGSAGLCPVGIDSIVGVDVDIGTPWMDTNFDSRWAVMSADVISRQDVDSMTKLNLHWLLMHWPRLWATTRRRKRGTYVAL